MAKKKSKALIPPQGQAPGQWLELFLEFISQLVIDSKEGGVGPLELYGTQRRFLAEIIDGLERGIHTFICLKAIQLGASTISLAIILFWIAVHPRMQAVLVTDTDSNRQKFRLILKRFIASLPRSYRVGIAKGGDNREHMVLENGSILDFLVAGTRASAIEVGRSRAYNVAYLTEVANYGAIEGVVSLLERLAEKHPDRLFLLESTAKGFNLFWKLWTKARENIETQKAFFVGWWPLALDTPLPTPTGWTTMGDVRNGDALFDDQGNPCTVVGMSPVFMNRDCYRIEFDNGDHIVADADHEWRVIQKRGPTGGPGKTLDVPTRFLASGHSIAVTKPLRCDDIDLPIDPYLLGVWLGGGSTSRPRITCGFEDMEEMRQLLLDRGCRLGGVSKTNGKAGQFEILGMCEAFGKLGLLGNKHIPSPYLRASEHQRRELMAGLMDTEGWITTKDLHCGFGNVDPRIMEGTFELLVSLGIKVSVFETAAKVKKFPNGRTARCRESTQLGFRELPEFPVFKLSRKRSLQEKSARLFSRRTKVVRIVSVEKVSSVPVKCVSVDTASHLFLAGRTMIPTHNSKEDYSIPQSDPLFAKYWDGTVDSLEQERINKAWEKYGVRITPEQLVWYRWKYDTSADTSLFDQNFPWDEEDAFIQTGQSFFPIKRMAKLVHDLSNNPPPFKGYAYEFSDTFMHTKVESVNDVDQAQLKIYEEPSEMGKYVIGVDPAFGRSSNQDRSVVQVCRCYADRLVQVAEFASASPESYQVAWVTAHLAGLYKNVMLIIEISGPGEATVLELKHLRQLFDAGALPNPGNGEITDLFGAARYYMYHRSDSPGAGFQYNWKALSLDTRLVTPRGWTTMGRVELGDHLIDDRGKPARVMGLSPIFLNRPCYSVNFDDGTSITADENHLWSVTRNRVDGRKGGRVHEIRKTSELLPGKHIIERARPFDLPPQNLPIDPYVLGVWLGDGQSSGGSIHAPREDILEIGSSLRSTGARLGPVHRRKTVSDRVVKGLQKTLAENGLLDDKHIPEQYLRGSLEQRLALLQGLMDTDGSASQYKGRCCDFTTSNGKLAIGFAELLRTLGFKPKFCTRHRTLDHRGAERACDAAHPFHFVAAEGFPVFRMPRKQKRIDDVKTTRKNERHGIVSVNPVDSVPVRCVRVDSPSHLYLAGDGMIPTHNTGLENKLSIMNQLRDSMTIGMVEVRSIQCAIEIQSLVQDGFNIEPAVSTDKDDRVFGMAFAHRAWTDWVRPAMIDANETWERVTKAEEAASKGDHDHIVSHIVSAFFQGKQEEREEREIQDAWDE